MATFRTPELKGWQVVCGCPTSHEVKVPSGIDPEDVECGECNQPQLRLGVPLNLIRNLGKER